MLLGKMINNAASLNDFRSIGSVCYVLGDKVTMNFQLFDEQLKLRYVPPSTAIITVTFNNMDGTTFTQVGSFIDPLDQSLITVPLTAIQTAQLLGGNVTFTVDVLGDATQILRGMIFSALNQVITNLPINM